MKLKLRLTECRSRSGTVQGTVTRSLLRKSVVIPAREADRNVKLPVIEVARLLLAASREICPAMDVLERALRFRCHWYTCGRGSSSAHEVARPRDAISPSLRGRTSAQPVGPGY